MQKYWCKNIAKILFVVQKSWKSVITLGVRLDLWLIIIVVGLTRWYNTNFGVKKCKKSGVKN